MDVKGFSRTGFPGWLFSYAIGPLLERAMMPRGYKHEKLFALAISLEEDERAYADFAEGLRESFPASAVVFDSMRAEETTHRQRLLSLYLERFGEHIPLLRRQDVKGFVHRKPVCQRLPKQNDPLCIVAE